jgi:hypothetical protein
MRALMRGSRRNTDATDVMSLKAGALPAGTLTLTATAGAAAPRAPPQADNNSAALAAVQARFASRLTLSAPPRPDAAAFARRLREAGDDRAGLADLLGAAGRGLAAELEVEDFLRARGCGSGVPAAAKAIACSRLGDPSFWAGRYALFVQWSPDASHPWDGAPGADEPAATLELAVLDSGGVAAFLDGAAVDFVFDGGVLRTTSPLPCAAPDGSSTWVRLALSFTTAPEAGADEGAFLGPQCHGVMWADSGVDASGNPAPPPPADWPVAPPRVAGKANTGARPVAACPPAAPHLASFEGEYETLLLPPGDASGARGDGPARSGPPLLVDADGRVFVAGVEARGAGLSPAGILTWPSTSSIGGGWMHCGHHAAGPLLLGCFGVPGGPIPAGRPFDVLAERTGAPSVYLSADAVDTSAATLEAAGLAAAATARLGTALAAAAKAWAAALGGDDELARGWATDAADAAAGAAACDASRAELEAAFGPAGLGLVVAPEESVGAARAQEAAAEHAKAARQAADAADTAAAGAASAAAAGAPAPAAAKAAAAAYNAARAAAAAAAAEESAAWAAAHGRATRMRGSLYQAAVAAAAYNDARDGARAASAAAAAGGAAALAAAQRLLAQLAVTADYGSVKDVADACAAGSASAAATREALDCWDAGTAAARARCAACTTEAADHAAQMARCLRASAPGDGGAGGALEGGPGPHSPAPNGPLALAGGRGGASRSPSPAPRGSPLRGSPLR